MNIKRLIAGITGVTVLTGSALILTAFLGKADSYSTDTAGYRSISEDVEATGDVHGVDSMTYYSTVTAPVDYYELKTGDVVTAGERVVGYDLEDLLNIRDQLF